MNVDQLKAFHKVAATGSFTKAAREFCLTQSAVSRQIRALEDEIGGRLFDRSGRRINLTGEGIEALRSKLRGIRSRTDSRRFLPARRWPGSRGTLYRPGRNGRVLRHPADGSLRNILQGGHGVGEHGARRRTIKNTLTGTAIHPIIRARRNRRE